MNVPKVTSIKPTNRKVRKAKEVVQQVSESFLPKELPIEKEVRIVSQFELFERIKDKLQIAIDRIKSE